MWHRPQLMTAVSDLLFVAGAAALVVAAAVWVARLPLYPIKEVVVTNELHEVQRNEVERSLAGRLGGNFFSVNLEGVRASLEELPWVRNAQVRRQWPARIEVSLEEHVPVAYWGQGTGQLVNSHREIFTATMLDAPKKPMPVLFGPTGFVSEMLDYYLQAETILKPVGHVPQAVNVSPRLALQLKLDDGMVVELGRQQAKAPVSERLQRFVANYESVVTAAKGRPQVVDMRYPNGFALHVAAAPAIEGKEGKRKP